MAGLASPLVAAVAALDRAQIKAMLKNVDAGMTRELSGLRTYWGVSSPCANSAELHSAHREAALATLLVRRLGFGRHVAIEAK